MEIFKIFDENQKVIGLAPREEVHRLGLWHETFHCWLVDTSNRMIYMQLRSENKKDYPGLFDITAAGHLLHTESEVDGVRELEEELGIKVPFSDLTKLNTITCSIENEKIKDHEFAHVYAYMSEQGFKNFSLQVEEVAGMVHCSVDDFEALWLGEKDQIEVNGFKIDEINGKIAISQLVNEEQFVIRDKSYYLEVVQKIKSLL